MVWSVFNYLLTQKLPRKAKVALVADRCSQYKKLLKTLKVAQKLQSTVYLCLARKGWEVETIERWLLLRLHKDGTMQQPAWTHDNLQLSEVQLEQLPNHQAET